MLNSYMQLLWECILSHLIIKFCRYQFYIYVWGSWQLLFYPWKQNISINVIIYLPYNIVDKCDPKFSRAPNDTTYNANSYYFSKIQLYNCDNQYFLPQITNRFWRFMAKMVVVHGTQWTRNRKKVPIYFDFSFGEK